MSRWVADRMRVSTGIGLRDPTRVTVRSSSTRSSLTCIIGGMSPISSRNSVPPVVLSNRPFTCAIAPVNDPRSWPNSSTVPAPALQVFRRAARRLPSWIARATSSLPLPDGPVISTDASLGATWPISVRTSRMIALSPINSGVRPRSGTISRNAVTPVFTRDPIPQECCQPSLGTKNAG